MSSPFLSGVNRRIAFMEAFIQQNKLTGGEKLQALKAFENKEFHSLSEAARIEQQALEAEFHLIAELKKNGNKAVQVNLEALELGLEAIYDQLIKDENIPTELAKAGVQLNSRLMEHEWMPKEWMRSLMDGESSDTTDFKEAMHTLHLRKRRLKAAKEALETRNGFTIVKAGSIKESVRTEYVDPALHHYRAQIAVLKIVRLIDVMKTMDANSDEYKSLSGKLKQLKIKYGNKTYSKKPGRIFRVAISLSPYDPGRRISPYEINWRMKAMEVKADVKLSGQSKEGMQTLIEDFLNWMEKNPQRGYAAFEEMIPFVAAAGTVAQVNRLDAMINLYIKGNKDSETGLPKSYTTVLNALWATKPDEDQTEDNLAKYLEMAHQFKTAVANQDEEVLGQLHLKGLPVEVSFHKEYRQMQLEEISEKNAQTAFATRLNRLRGSLHLHGYVQTMSEILKSEDFRANAHRWVIDLLNKKGDDIYHHQAGRFGDAAHKVIRFFTDVFKDDDSLLIKLTRVSLLITILTGTTLTVGASIALAVLAGSIIPVVGAILTTIFTVVALIGLGFTTWKVGNGIIDLLKEMTEVDDQREVKDVRNRTAYNYYETMAQHGFLCTPIKAPQDSLLSATKRYIPFTTAWKMREKENALLKSWNEEWEKEKNDHINSGKTAAAADYLYAMSTFVDKKMQKAEERSITSRLAYAFLSRERVNFASIRQGMLNPDGNWDTGEPVAPREHLKRRLDNVGYTHGITGVPDMDFISVMTMARDAGNWTGSIY